MWLQSPANGKDGASFRESFEQVERSTGHRPKELDGPELPTGAEYLWSIFVELHNTRGGGMGPAPISYSEIKAYMDLTKKPLEAWEVDAVKAMDRAFMKVEADKQKRQSKEK